LKTIAGTSHHCFGLFVKSECSKLAFWVHERRFVLNFLVPIVDFWRACSASIGGAAKDVAVRSKMPAV